MEIYQQLPLSLRHKCLNAWKSHSHGFDIYEKHLHGIQLSYFYPGNYTHGFDIYKKKVLAGELIKLLLSLRHMFWNTSKSDKWF